MCVIGDQPELTVESLEIGHSQSFFSWRNVFSCINLLRILNKLTKWKHSRIMVSRLINNTKFLYFIFMKINIYLVHLYMFADVSRF